MIGVVVLVLVVTAVGPFWQSPAQPRTTALPVPATATAQLKDLQAVSAGLAWVFMTALDGTGLLYASTDGRAWSQLAIPQSVAAQKYGIQLIDARHGLLQLQRGLMSTADAGRSWHQVPLPPGQSFGLGAHFITADRGYYQDLAAYPNQAAQPSSMWWTANGGASWKLIWQVNADHPAAGAIPLDGTKYVLAFDGSNGWLVVGQGDSERLFETIDGGQSWSTTSLPVSDAEPLAWAQAGWSAKGAPWPVPWAFGTQNTTVAFVFSRVLVAGSGPRVDGTYNKVTWVAKDRPAGVAADYPFGTTAVGVEARPLGESQPVVTGAGVADLLKPGCWTFRLAWSAHGQLQVGTINLEVLPPDRSRRICGPSRQSVVRHSSL